MKTIFLLVLIIPLFTGCGNLNGAVQNNLQNTRPINAGQINRYRRSSVYSQPEKKERDRFTPDEISNLNIEKAAIISDKLNQIAGIANAIVTVSGNKALVGINFEEGITEDMMGGYEATIKNDIDALALDITSITVTMVPELAEDIISTGDENEAASREMPDSVESLFNRPVPAF